MYAFEAHINGRALVFHAETAEGLAELRKRFGPPPKQGEDDSIDSLLDRCDYRSWTVVLIQYEPRLWHCHLDDGKHSSNSGETAREALAGAVRMAEYV